MYDTMQSTGTPSFSVSMDYLCSDEAQGCAICGKQDSSLHQHLHIQRQSRNARSRDKGNKKELGKVTYLSLCLCKVDTVFPEI